MNTYSLLNIIVYSTHRVIGKYVCIMVQKMGRNVIKFILVLLSYNFWAQPVLKQKCNFRGSILFTTNNIKPKTPSFTKINQFRPLNLGKPLNKLPSVRLEKCTYLNSQINCRQTFQRLILKLSILSPSKYYVRCVAILILHY